MTEKISSPQNPRIKRLIQLQAKSRERRRQNLMVIEGYREITRAIESGIKVREIYVCMELDTAMRAGQITETHNIPFFEVSLPVFGKLAYRDGSDGLIALAEPGNNSLENLRVGENPLIIVLESVEKPGNLGAVMRTADAAGVDAVIVCDPLTDLYNPNTIRSSVGCIFTTPVAVADTSRVMEWLSVNRVNSYAAALTSTAQEYYRNDYRGATAFVMGTEATGLSRKWLDYCSAQVIIPMMGIADSLNVSVSTAVLVYEALRQRKA